MAARKINFSGLPALVQDLVISKLAVPEAANLGMTSREMRAEITKHVERLKREHAVAAEARAELFRVLPEILKKPFRDPAPQHVTIGKYTVSTTQAGGDVFKFYLTVAAVDMSFEFCVWGTTAAMAVSQNCLLVGGKKKHFVPEMKKYDSIRKDVADITNCLKMKIPGVYYL
jgi:2-methylaconitate cis-trans-isomerase PrpF